MEEKKGRTVFVLRVRVNSADFAVTLNDTSSCFKYLLSLSFSVLSGLCSNDCPDGVKVTTPFSLLLCATSCTCPCMRMCVGALCLLIILSHSCIFLKSICSAFWAGRHKAAGIQPLLATFIVSPMNRLYIQEMKDGDLNNKCLPELWGSLSRSLYLICLIVQHDLIMNL